MELKNFGNCSKGDLCKFCNNTSNLNSQTNTTIDKNPILNIKAKEFIPKKKMNTNTNTNTNNNMNVNSNISNTNVTNNSDVENKLLKLNLNASEYVPNKSNTTNSSDKLNSYSNSNFVDQNQKFPENTKEEYFDEVEPNDDELDMIMKDMMENDDIECEEESDDEKWFPKFKDCDCCKGFVYKCKGNACQYLGACYCKVKNECDDGNN